MENQPGQRPQNEREWRLLERMLLSIQDENRRQRRWSIFFRLLTFAYLFILLFMFMSGPSAGLRKPVGEFTAVVDVNGIIAPEADASADMIITGLRDAFEAEGTRAVLLRINSPGGSPVQARFVYNEIRRLRDEYPDVKVYAAITDVGASGAYYIAAAADEIFADPASLVGSIGVIMAGFGFTDAIDRLGIERRLLTAGENKAVLDPFEPMRADERAHVQGMLDIIHRQFIAAVREGRGERLNEAQYDDIFTGLFWTGEEALARGLVDGLMSPGEVAREVIGVEEMYDFTPRPHPLDEFMRQFGVSVGMGVARVLGLEGAVLR